MNQRTLDRLLPTLTPRLIPAQETALRDLARLCEESGYTLTGHDHDAGVFHVTFSSDRHTLTWSIHEVVVLAARLDDFPWEDQLRAQGQAD